MQKIKHIYTQYGFYLPVLLAFLLSTGYNLNSILLVWGICFFLFEDVKQSFKNVLNNKWSYVFFAFLILYVILSLFSENKKDAVFETERKLIFLAFPILLFSSHKLALHYKKIFLAFIAGCVVTLVLCLLRATFLYFSEGINAFFYSDFNYFMHPSYFAMYLTFALFIFILFGKQWLGHIKHYFVKIGIVSTLLIIGIFLCASKSGILVAALMLPLTLMIVLYNKGHKKGILALVLSIAILIPVTYVLFPVPYNRIRSAFEVTNSVQNINKSETDGTAVRILIWGETIDLIKVNFLFGVTPGDVNDALNKAYTKHELTGALEKKLNTHNEYLQTFLATGVIGFVLLCFMTLGVSVISIIQKNYLLTLLGILSTLNFLVESMLESQSGFTFFGLFLCLMLQYNPSKSSNSTD